MTIAAVAAPKTSSNTNDNNELAASTPATPAAVDTSAREEAARKNARNNAPQAVSFGAVALAPRGKSFGPMTHAEWVTTDPNGSETSLRKHARMINKRARQVDGHPFEPAFVREAGLKFRDELARSGDRDKAWEAVRAHLASHPSEGWRISPEVEFKTINGAGGAYFRMAILFCGPKGYVAALENTVGTDGPSGRYHSNFHIYDTALYGQIKVMGNGRRDHVVASGDTGYLEQDDAHVFRAGPMPEGDPDGLRFNNPEHDGVYLLEQGVGPLFRSRAFAFAVIEPAGPMGDRQNSRAQIGQCFDSMAYQRKQRRARR